MEFYNKRHHCVVLACYLPLDTASNARKFIAHFKPKDVFFVKYDFWNNHLLAGIGIHQTTLSGDTRYDRMIAVRDKGDSNEILADFTYGKPTLILGSSWPVDEDTLLTSLLELHKRMKIIIAPHDISEQHISAIAALFGNEVVRYTNYVSSPENQVLILDTIGQLTSAYRYATIAYVGGGFTGKLHNILEPGAFGIPVIFGPKHERFPEAQLFLDLEVAVEVTDSGELEELVSQLLKRKTEIAEELKLIFQENSGAAKKVVAGLKD